jgi:phosphatidylserine/phosphatidylglycerophosphate/cardiolipin synthase-like enzyme
MIQTICVVLLVSLLRGSTASAADGFDCRVSPKFSSRDSLLEAVSESLRQAKQQVTLALYGFNNNDLAEELVKLAKKGVVVRVKIDTAKGAEKKTSALIGRLKSGGVEVRTVAPGGRNHNKFAVIDGTRVLTGSYNWTAKAESNWENLLILDCAELAKSYESEWEKIR